MSIQAISYVLQNSPTRLWDRLVLISLANHANDQLETWPSVQTISHEAGMHERTVQRSLRRLEQIGEIAPAGNRSAGGRRSTRYVLVGFLGFTNGVGGPTASEPRKTLANPTVSLGKRQDKGRKRADTPAARHPTPGKVATPGVAYMPPLPRRTAGGAPATLPPLPAKADTPAPAARHPSPGKAATLTVLEPSLNQVAPNSAGGAPASTGGAPPIPTLSPVELRRHLAEVAAGKKMPTWVSGDYQPDEPDPLMVQIREAERQKRELQERGSNA